MFQALLNSIIVVPVLLGILVARSRGQRGLMLLLAVMLAYAAFNIALLYYLRHRWV